MNKAVHANAPEMTLADDDWRKMPGCSNSCVKLLAAVEIPAEIDDKVFVDSVIVDIILAKTETNSNNVP